MQRHIDVTGQMVRAFLMTETDLLYLFVVVGPSAQCGSSIPDTWRKTRKMNISSPSLVTLMISPIIRAEENMGLSWHAHGRRKDGEP